MNETWKPVPGYELSYQVSSLGRVRSLTRTRIVKNCHGGTSYRTDRGRIMKDHSVGIGGYRYVSLRNDGKKRKNFFVHRLVADAFCERRSGCEYVDHIDYDRRNNRADNLRWVTAKENVAHSYDHIIAGQHNRRLKERESEFRV